MKLVKDVLGGKKDITAEDVKQLVGMMCDLYDSQPNVVEIPARRAIFVGDLHGDLDSALAVRDYFLKSKDYSMIFLGDYGDRGPAQVETFNLVMALALQFPNRVVMLRGNHESDEVATRYGFYMDISRKYSHSMFEHYLNVFTVLPLAGLSSNGIFCCHGGVPENVNNLSQILAIDRCFPNFPDDIAYQMVWNDPKDRDFDFRPSCRGRRMKYFGQVAFDRFSADLGIELMLRSHEVFEEGFKSFFGGRLFSVFTATAGGTVKPKIARLKDDLKIKPVPI